MRKSYIFCFGMKISYFFLSSMKISYYICSQIKYKSIYFLIMNNKSSKKNEWNILLIKRIAAKWQVTETFVRQILSKKAKSTTAVTISKDYFEFQNKIKPHLDKINEILESIK